MENFITKMKLFIVFFSYRNLFLDTKDLRGPTPSFAKGKCPPLTFRDELDFSLFYLEDVINVENDAKANGTISQF